MSPRAPPPRRQGRHPVSAGGGSSSTAVRDWKGLPVLRRGSATPFSTDAGPGLPDLPSKRSDRCEQVEANPRNGPGPIRGGFDPLHFRILKRWLRVLQKMWPVLRPEKPRRTFPVARGQ